MKRFIRAVASLIVVVGAASASAQDAPAHVTVYSGRDETQLKPVFERYTRETGIEVRLHTERRSSFAERLATEGADTPADLLVIADVGNLWTVAERGLLRPVQSDALDRSVPSAFRDPEGRWYGLSRRERTIFYARDRVDPATASSYEALADPRWRGKLCLRTARQGYTQSLVAMLIAQHGSARAEQIVRGWVDNLATDVFTNDTVLLEAIAAGRCDVGIANVYYYTGAVKQNPALAEQVKLLWADQGAGQGGVHVNLSGAGVVRHAKNPEGARRLLEWMVSERAQADYVEGLYERPVNPAVEPDPVTQSWGRFTPDATNGAVLGARQAEAIKLLARTGYK